MFNNLSLKRLTSGVTLILVTSGVILSILAIVIRSNVAEAEQKWSIYASENDYQSILIRNIVGNLGYGGMIHEFKNLVLRGGDERAALIKNASGAVLADLEQLSALVTDDASQKAIQGIRETVMAYERAVPVVMIQNHLGQTPEKTDEKVKIDDSPALTGLAHFLDGRDADTKGQLLNRIRRDIGYGGMIHQFKNLVLRKDAERAQKVFDAANSAKATIVSYRRLHVSEGELQALAAIEAVIDKYAQAAQEVLRLIEAGEDARGIDKVVKISDGDAIQGLRTLVVAIVNESGLQARQIDEALQRSETVMLVLSAAVVLSFVALTAGITIAVRQSALAPAARISEAVSALAEGNTDVDVDADVSDTEIGRIARSCAAFKDLMLRNAELTESARRDMEKAQAMSEEQAQLLEEQKALQAAQDEHDRHERALTEQRKALQAEIQEAIDKARSGQLDHRISEDYAEAGLASIAGDFNQLLATIAQSMRAIAQVTTQLASGDLTARMEGHYSGDFARLQTGFEAALSELSLAIGKVVTGSTLIEDEVQAISASARDLSKRTESQASTLESTASALEEVTKSVESVSESADGAKSQVQSADEVAKHGGVVVAEAVGAMEMIVQSSAEISKVTDLIEEIAFQTNLLALNAGVEAARAGEAGRGFAVVASEVRGLAHRSSDAVKDINNLISKSEAEIQSGREKVRRAGDSIGEISGLIGALAGVVNHVAASTTEQATSLSEINSSLAKIDKITQENAAMFEETAASTTLLSDRASELRTTASGFRIGEIEDEDDHRLAS